MKNRSWRRLAIFAFLLPLGACDGPWRNTDESRMPTDTEAAAYFQGHQGFSGVELSGNVVEVRVVQPFEQLRRGGTLWARVGPYIYLFSPGARDLLAAYPEVAALRVVTRTDAGEEVARAMLRRDRLSDILWRRSLNLLGHALQTGTEQPNRLDDLVQWGEKHTEYEYSPEFVGR